ncbi:MAG: TetR/AcrR family transcriptional regulator [Gammaproteobacteria bacterium]
MSAGRPQQYQSENVFQAVMQTFWEHGYDGTSLRDLLDATGLSKSSFYEIFAHKQDALERSLARYCDLVVAELSCGLAAAPSASAFIEGVLAGAAGEGRDNANPRGCMLVNVATEFSARDAQIRARVAVSVERVTRVLVTAIRRGQREGDIGADHDANALGRYVLASLCGLRTLVKAGASQRALRDVIRVVMSTLR